MASENFLTNPPRSRRRRRTVTATTTRRRKRSGGLPSALLRRMMKTYGPRRGMREAWKAYRGGARNPAILPRSYSRRVSHRPVVYGVGQGSGMVWKRSPLARGPRLSNPFGEEAMIVGFNPRHSKRSKRKGVSTTMARKRRRRRSRIFALNPRHRIHRRRHLNFGELAMLNPRHRRHIRQNPVRRYGRRRHRRNPAARATGLPAISWRKPMSLLVPAAVGTGAFVACDYLPAKLGMTTTFPRLGVKAAVGIGGSMVVSKFLGKTNGTVWLIVSGVNILQDVLRTFVFQPTVLTTAGYGAFPYQDGGMAGDMGVAGSEGFGAFPGEQY